jgi:large subunit ribosomal protein L23
MAMHTYEVLRRPINTEKARRERMEKNQYAFEVDRRANKLQIKEAVEMAFRVNVVDVKVVVLPGKERTHGRYRGKPVPWKKALVTLAEGQRIAIFEGV